MGIEALLFDLGKVLVDFDFDLGMRRFAGFCPLPRDQFEAIVFHPDWIRRYELGEISTADYHQYLCETSGLTMDLAEFCESWSAVFLPGLIVPERLLAQLKARYPLILVSNTNESHVAYIARTYGIFEYFDHTIFSHEVGSLKPDRKIYEAAIAASGRSPQALFFADDREENVEAARNLGIQAHQFTSLAGLLDAFQAQGIDVGDFVYTRPERSQVE